MANGDNRHACGINGGLRAGAIFARKVEFGTAFGGVFVAQFEFTATIYLIIHFKKGYLLHLSVSRHRKNQFSDLPTYLCSVKHVRPHGVASVPMKLITLSFL
jgi:hypothetical protein